jgi:hypothetical protein
MVAVILYAGRTDVHVIMVHETAEDCIINLGGSEYSWSSISQITLICENDVNGQMLA